MIRRFLTYYGEFIKDIPRRLGTNAALDASVNALACAFPCVYTQKQTPEMLNSYIHALKTLRVYLSDPKKAYTSNTLCAIYLLEICQSWIGRRDDQHTSHGEVKAHFLNAAPVKEWQDSFEVDMLITVSAPVLIESFANPKIQLDIFFDKLADTYGRLHGPRKPPDPDGIDTGPIESINLRSIAKMGTFLHDPELHLPEITSMYQQLRIDSGKARRLLTEFTESTLAVRSAANSYILAKQKISYQALHGTLNVLALLLGSILRIVNPHDESLVEDGLGFASEVIQLAKDAAQYRPLGSGYIPLCLVAAWAATDGTPMQEEVESVLTDWQGDFEETRWLSMAVWLKGRLEDLRLRVSIDRMEMPLDEFYDPRRVARREKREAVGPMGSCCIS